MMLSPSLLDALLLLPILAVAAPSPQPQLLPAGLLSLTPYAPRLARCPSTPLVRPASSGLSTSEQAYIKQRKTKADAALATWLSKSGLTFSKPKTYPTIGLTSSGGGYRALLCGAGVHQAFDGRDSNVSTSGLYQALTYEAGLSGGSWLLSSIAANNWPTITSLVDGLWAEAFEDSLLAPTGVLAASALTAVTADIVAKQAAGFPPTLTDIWGRLLAYQLLYGVDGGVSDHFSDLRSLSNFTSFNVPYPIITSLGVKTQDGECLPGPNATQYEFSPYEFGSWDQGVSAFANTQYLGSNLNNGKPSSVISCITGLDDTGPVLGTSSNLFNEVCAPSKGLATALTKSSSALKLAVNMGIILNNAHQLSTRDQYASYVNPFFNYTPSTLVSPFPELHLVDGGEALQNNPVWPFLHRPSVDVLIVNDNSADTSANYPNGSAILTTYVQAVAAGLTCMPAISSVETFIAEGLNVRPTFFGCNDKSKMTIVYLPNTNYTYHSGQSTAKLRYTEAETRAMVANGVQVGSRGGNETWAGWLGCGIMAKSGVTLPTECKQCLAEFCYS